MITFKQHLEEKALGDCYEKSYKAVTGKYKDWMLVHGIATGTGGEIKGKRYGHAWIEKGEQVLNLDPIKMMMPKLAFYAIGKIDYAVTYTQEEAIKQALKSRHYGPWDKKSWEIDDRR